MSPLNRPEALNALDDELNEELCDIWSDFNESSNNGDPKQLKLFES